MSLTEKQEYYSWNNDYWATKTPPVLDPIINQTLLELGGVDGFGHQRWRLVWDDRETKPGFAVQPNGTWKAQTVLKYPHVKARRPKFYCYKNEQEQTVRVARQGLIPKHAGLSWIEYETIVRGRLRLLFEQKFTLEELVLCGYYPAPDSEAGKRYGVDPLTGERFDRIPDARGEYQAIFPLETPDGKYFEPDRDWLESIKKQHFEDQQKTQNELQVEAFARMEQAEFDALVAEDEYAGEVSERLLIEAEKAPQSLVYSHS